MSDRMSDRTNDRNAFVRFSAGQRIEHILLILSFTTLVITGLPQKYAGATWAEWMISAMGGIEVVRVIHRIAATTFILETVYHFAVIGYKLFVARLGASMIPTFQDAKDAAHALLYNLGLAKTRPRMGRYTFDEKAEYWALMWGSVVMVLTGFMLWNPIATARLLPGQYIPAAKAAHGGEALLAFLAILVWHLYHVHIRGFNKSIFTGKLTREEMAHEHPLELAAIESGTAPTPAPKVQRNKRERIYLPVAAVVSLALMAVTFYFVTFEETAIATVPPVSSVPAFLPQTPTPFPTAAPTDVPPPPANTSLTWEGLIGAAFQQRCGSCHGTLGGLSVATYADLMKGGAKGPAIVPGEPDNSSLVVLMAAGGHPGKFSPEELEQVKAWIAAGAPEQ
jgi:cytochrome b subunit of formate dehydrogenase